METLLSKVIIDSVRFLASYLNMISLLQFVFFFVVFYAIKGIYLFAVLRVHKRYHHSISYIREGNSKIIIAGDSTAVGTGSAHIERTIGGFLAKDFPNTSIINCGINGARTSAIIDQLARTNETACDMVIISTGGNDVWACTPLSHLETHLTLALREAKRISSHRVILLFFGNEGSAPFFPFFIRWFIMRRTDLVKEVFAKVCTREMVPLIELFSEPKENPFVYDPKKYFAQDGLHPSDAGYWEWYKHLWRLMIQKNYHYNEPVFSEK